MADEPLCRRHGVPLEPSPWSDEVKVCPKCIEEMEQRDEQHNA